MTIDDIEAVFLHQRTLPPALGCAWLRAFAPVSDGLPERDLGAMRQGGLAVAAAIDAWALRHAEPPYHNRHHAAEATLAMGLLCREARSAGLVAPREAALGVLAMVGHDMHHDGSITGAGVLEARSSAAVRPILAGAGLDRASLDAVTDIILATAPEAVAGNAARLRGRDPSGREVLRVLANEADVFASVLPRLGPQLNHLLDREWMGPDAAERHPVGTAAGRWGFLRAYPGFSAPALALGLGAARDRCRAAYVRVGLVSGAGSTAEAGCDALDRLDHDRAADMYLAALTYVAAMAALPA